MSEKNLTITLGNKETTENLISMYENAAIVISDILEKSMPTTKVAAQYTPAIKLQNIKRILFSERKYEPEQGLNIVFLKDGTQVPATPAYFYTVNQLDIFLKWLMTAIAKEKQKLGLMNI